MLSQMAKILIESQEVITSIDPMHDASEAIILGLIL